MNRFIAFLVAMVLACVTLGATASPADAHTGNLHAKVTCVNGKQHVDYTLTLSNVPNGVHGSTKWDIGNTNFNGTPGSNAGLTRGPVDSVGNQTINLGSEDYAGDYTGAGNWVYAFTNFTNNNKVGSDGRVDKFDGNCKPPVQTDAFFSNAVSQPTCDTGAVLTYSGSNVTFSRPSPVTETGVSVTVTATPTDGHGWSDGTTDTRTVFSGVLAGPTGNCPQPPPVVPPNCDECHIAHIATNAPKVTKCEGVLDDVVLNNVVVPKGAQCTLVDVRLNGSVRSHGGRSVYLAHTIVRGDVNLHGITGDVTFGSKDKACKADPYVGGSIFVKNSHNVLLCRASVCKDIILKANDGRITIRHSRARDVFVQNNNKFVSDGNVDHNGADVIRLLNVKADHFFVSGNAPRHVLRK